MDSDKTMEAVAEGAKAVTKLQEIIQKMINPYLTRKQDKANAEADKRKIKMIRDNPDMEIVFANGETSIRQRTPEELAQRAEQRLFAEAVRQENNIENVIDVATADLSLENDVVDKTVDEDWVARLFNIAKDVSNTEMQYVWGKILAGEIKRPGSFSLRTLDVTRNLSTNEATIFQKLLPLICRMNDILFITTNNDMLSKYNISYHDILLLEECGLLKLSSDTGIKIPYNKEFFLYTKKRIVFFERENNSTITMQYKIHPLTVAGEELFFLLCQEVNNEYFVDLIKDVVSKNKSINLSAKIHEVTEIGKNKTIVFSDDILIEIKV